MIDDFIINSHHKCLIVGSSGVHKMVERYITHASVTTGCLSTNLYSSIPQSTIYIYNNTRSNESTT